MIKLKISALVHYSGEKRGFQGPFSEKKKGFSGTKLKKRTYWWP